jgi:integrase
MTPFPRGKAGNLSLYIPQQVGVRQRSTGTTDAKLVKTYEAAIEWLVHQTPPAWDILAALAAGTVSFEELRAVYSAGRNALPPLRARLEDIPLLPLLDAFDAAWRADGRAAGTLANYRREITAYLVVHPMRSQFTAANVRAHIRGLTVSSGSRRKQLYALRAFERYLVEVGTLSGLTLHTIRAPKKNPARKEYRTAAVDTAIVTATPARYRAFCAFIHATGADVTPALRMLGRDLDLDRLRCHVPGRKTPKRDRHEVEIDAWARPFLEELRTVLPNAPLFPGITRHKASWAHKQAATAVQAGDYTLRDARHSIAVRWRWAGRSFEAIAQQLGNSVWQCVTVYGAFHPDDAPAQAGTTTTDSTTRAADGARSLSLRKA